MSTEQYKRFESVSSENLTPQNKAGELKCRTRFIAWVCIALSVCSLLCLLDAMMTEARFAGWFYIFAGFQWPLWIMLLKRRPWAWWVLIPVLAVGLVLGVYCCLETWNVYGDMYALEAGKSQAGDALLFGSLYFIFIDGLPLSFLLADRSSSWAERNERHGGGD